jgi:hypothetical protein
MSEKRSKLRQSGTKIAWRFSGSVDGMSTIVIKRGTNGRLSVAKIEAVPARHWHPEEKVGACPILAG